MGHDLSSLEEHATFNLNAFQRQVRNKLERYTGQLEERFPSATLVVCLFGSFDLSY